MTAYLADDRIVSGGDRVEDPLDAFKLLLIAGGDPVKSLIIVLQSAAALTGGETGSEGGKSASPSPSPRQRNKFNDCWKRAGRFHLHVNGVSHLHVSHLHQSGEVHLLLHLPVAPHLHRGISGLQLGLKENGQGERAGEGEGRGGRTSGRKEKHPS